MAFKPTDEQARAAELYLTGEPLRVEALAGTGKTTLLEYLVSLGSPRRGEILYTSFGAKNVADAKGRFPGSCKVKTNHALAFSVGAKYQSAGRLIGRLSPGEIARFFRWTDNDFAPAADYIGGAYAVIETLNAFLQSADDQVLAIHATGPARRACRGDLIQAQSLIHRLVAKATQLWEEMTEGFELGVTHDVYLKQWALSNPRIRATTIMLDEAQDTSELMVDVLRRQEHAQLIVVGDRRQAIYGFRGAIDAMDSFDIRNSANLTQSFRFGPEIAELANTVLEHQCKSTVLLRGDPNQPGVVDHCPRPTCYLARTNASLIGQLFLIDGMDPGARIGIVGGVEDLVKLVQGAERLLDGLPTPHPELAEFSSWVQVQSAVELDGYAHLRKLVQAVDSYGTGRLQEKLQRIRGNETRPDSCDVMLSTAHKAKGAEFAAVKMLDDFAPMGPKDDPGAFGWTPEEANLIYVAATRARKHLDIGTCEAVLVTAPARYRWDPFAESAAADEEAPEDAAEPTDAALDAGLAQAEADFFAVDAPLKQLLAGRWAHPFIEGGHIDIEHAEHGTVVRVFAGSCQLFETWGAVSLGAEEFSCVVATVGTGQVHVPLAAVTLTE